MHPGHERIPFGDGMVGGIKTILLYLGSEECQELVRKILWSPSIITCLVKLKNGKILVGPNGISGGNPDLKKKYIANEDKANEDIAK